MPEEKRATIATAEGVENMVLTVDKYYCPTDIAGSRAAGSKESRALTRCPIGLIFIASQLSINGG
jgi:hypothetical protein